MSGHSKWATIKRAKGITDAKRGALFTRLAKDITTAIKISNIADPAFNPVLKVAIEKAKAANMPGDNIQRAIDKGAGISKDTQIIFENTYEIYGPDGSTYLVDTETDNPNRTLTELKTLANKNGGKFANEGSISWKFKEVGIVELDMSKIIDLEKISQMELDLLDINGVEDIVNRNKIITMYILRQELKNVTDEITKKYPDIQMINAKIIKKTEDLIQPENYSKVEEFEEHISDCADIVNIWKNYNDADEN
jgi:YebC/PmpR family DNA-binding regulatory protein